jgi:hypothetical protein
MFTLFGTFLHRRLILGVTDGSPLSEKDMRSWRIALEVNLNFGLRHAGNKSSQVHCAAKNNFKESTLSA